MKVSDKVSWSIRSHGQLPKVGVILAVVPPGQHPDIVMANFPEGKYYGENVLGQARTHESYIVSEIKPNSKGRYRIFWPVVAKLEKVK
jgi:hypothetical protein